MLNLLRWVSARTMKENFIPPRTIDIPSWKTSNQRPGAAILSHHGRNGRIPQQRERPPDIWSAARWHGPGVLVIQEWWGLDSGIKEVADRLGAAGFVALAPDLYHGELAGARRDGQGRAADAEPCRPTARAAT